MQIIHRISLASSGEIREELARLGVVVADHGFVSFEIDEADETWPGLRDWIPRRRAVDIARTKFSKKELGEARWLELVPSWHWGYPQPDEGEFGYRRATYDLAEWCPECGLGLRQKAPFQMKGEPKWGKKGILQLNWVFDEYFATPEVWSSAFEPHGVGRRSVLKNDGSELKTVVQLVIEEEVGVVTSSLVAERCGKCSRTRYLPATRGRFPALIREPTRAIARTSEYFGSGAQASRRVMVSQDLARTLDAKGIRGASFRPVQVGVE